MPLPVSIVIVLIVVPNDRAPKPLPAQNARPRSYGPNTLSSSSSSV